MLANYIPALIRTVAALAVGWLLSLPLAHPVLSLLGQSSTDPATKEKLVSALSVILAAAWYAAVHALEKRYPAASWLLGSNQQPVAYSKTTGPFAAGPGAVPPGTSLNPPATVGDHAAPDTDPSAMGGQATA